MIGKRQREVLTSFLRNKSRTAGFRFIFKNNWVLFSLLLVVLSIVARAFFWQPIVVPSQSMMPTIIAGDYIFSDRKVYGYSRLSPPMGISSLTRRVRTNITRGDIALIAGRDGKLYVKRIVGLGGERLQMVKGNLHINGVAVTRSRVTDFVLEETENSPCLNPAGTRKEIGSLVPFCRYRQYKETLPNGKSYMTLDLLPEAQYDSSKLILVPETNYYVMGDNRDRSLDSRASPAAGGMGLVHRDQVIARIDRIFFSENGNVPFWAVWDWLSALRGERFMKEIDG